MELNLNNTYQIVGIIAFAGCVLKYFIVNPLQTAINTLNDAVKDMKLMLNSLSTEQKDMCERIVACESSTKQAHHRIDGLEGRA